MNKETITKKLSTLIHHERKDKYARVNPFRDWRLIIIFSSFFVFILAVCSVYTYIGISRGTFYESKEEQGTIARSLDVKKLNEVVVFFEAKKARFEELRTATSSSVDPGVQR
jgi:hypothetical protein